MNHFWVWCDQWIRAAQKTDFNFYFRFPRNFLNRNCAFSAIAKKKKNNRKTFILLLTDLTSRSQYYFDNKRLNLKVRNVIYNFEIRRLELSVRSNSLYIMVRFRNLYIFASYILSSVVIFLLKKKKIKAVLNFFFHPVLLRMLLIRVTLFIHLIFLYFIFYSRIDVIYSLVDALLATVITTQKHFLLHT